LLELFLILIFATKKGTGLKIKDARDNDSCEVGRKVSDKDVETINKEYNDEHERKWNYRIVPVDKTYSIESYVNNLAVKKKKNNKKFLFIVVIIT